MVHHLGNIPENALNGAFAAIERVAGELGAGSVAVLVSEADRVEIVYRSPAGPGCDSELQQALIGAYGSADAQAMLARLHTGSDSWLLFISDATRRAVFVAFLYSQALPPAVFPPGVTDTLQLAAFAVWSFKETLYLRAELSVLARRIEQRKSVERAKGLLQAEKGITEQQAYECLRKMSRQRRITLGEAAENLLRTRRFP